MTLLVSCSAQIPVPTDSPTATPTNAIATLAPTPTLTPTTLLIPGTLASVRFPSRPDLPFLGGGRNLTDGRYALATLTNSQGSFEVTVLDLTTSASRSLDIPRGDLGGAFGLDAGRIALTFGSRSTAGEVWDYVVEDAASRTRTTIDRSQIPGIFHGQGSPIQPDAGFVLSGDLVAFNHLFVQDGLLWVEVRVGPIGGPMRAIVKAADPVAPLALTDTTIAYTVMARSGDTQLRVYELASRRDALVARGLFSFEAALSGGQLLYYARPYDAQPGRVVLRDLATGAERTIVTGACAFPSLNDRYATVTCGAGANTPNIVTMFDLTTLQRIDVARSSDVLANARMLPGAITWMRFVAGPPQAFFVETLRY